MAVSRGKVLLCCLGTLFVILMLFISASAEEDDEYSVDVPEIHVVSHTIDHGCKGGVDTEKGDQCQDNDDDDDDDLNEDVDDTYKIENQVKVSLTSAGKVTPPPETLANNDDLLEFNEDQDHDHVVVLGH
ncbi:hypothetical protein TIFTF001_001859 [Ficus carica]|uniref:Uncharacterized protein n=1 Tax=Ficus carica TaxID=3494 RepID=A0AA87Z8B6_FICCA|nr:hypothetical protein TIFTF001_001859 [Ficus carica]